MIRYLKIILVVFVGLQGFSYFAGNIANWEEAKGFVAYVLSLQDHTVYPNDIVPAITSPALVTLTLIAIVAGEFLVGAVSTFGALKMLGAARKPADQFNAAKTFAILGCGVGVLLWFGLFTVVGVGFFGMWQTALGAGSMDGAFVYFMSSGLVMLFVNMKDD